MSDWSVAPTPNDFASDYEMEQGVDGHYASRELSQAIAKDERIAAAFTELVAAAQAALGRSAHEELSLRIGALENQIRDHSREITGHHYRIDALEAPVTAQRQLRELRAEYRKLESTLRQKTLECHRLSEAMTRRLRAEHDAKPAAEQESTP